ncbi:MAG: hypothetical protein ACFCD0_27435 [Gemmataceae bacterium]
MWKKIKGLAVLWPKGLDLPRVCWIAGVVGLVVIAFFLGQHWSVAQSGLSRGSSAAAGTLSELRQNYGSPSEPVAYIHGNVPITRQDLGEYLISRFGPERLRLLVNQEIIKMHCRKHGIIVTAPEVESRLVKHLNVMGVRSLSEFKKIVLKKVGMTIFQYKEDVIRPKLALEKLCRKTKRIKVTPKDLKIRFEQKYGEKVECEMIAFSKGMNFRDLTEIRTRILKNPNEWKNQARKQPLAHIAAKEGKIPPIYKHYPNPLIEQTAFSLQNDAISGLLRMPDDSYVLLKCIKRLPPDTRHSFSDEQLQLQQEVFHEKLYAEIPKLFQELESEARAKLILQRKAIDGGFVRRINGMLHANALLQTKQQGGGTPNIQRGSIPRLPKTGIGPTPKYQNQQLSNPNLTDFRNK